MTLAQEIDDLMEQASQALLQMHYLTTERLCLKALGMARQLGDWQLYARILLPLQESRRQRRIIAAEGWILLGCSSWEQALQQFELDTPGSLLLTHPVTFEQAIELHQRLQSKPRLFEMLYADNPASADTWILRSCPSPALTVAIPAPPKAWREQVFAPVDHLDHKKAKQHLTLTPRAWFVQATEAMGDTAIKHATAPLGSLERVNQLEEALTAMTDHEFIHQYLAQAAQAVTA